MKPVKSIITFLALASLFTGLSTLNAQSDQSDSLGLIRTFPETLSDFEIDNLGNLYLVGNMQQIKKLSPTYDSMAVFNDLRHFGKLHSLDVSNPLKVLLFYKDFATIIILDRFLNIRTTLNLRTANIQQVSTITQSYDNNIWLYDELENAVKKIDESGKELVASPDFRVLFDDPPHPHSLQDFNRFLYAYDSTRGLLVMDYFGAYRNQLPFIGWKNMHGISQGIVATDRTGLVYYQPGSIETKHRELPREILNSIKIRLHNQQLFALDKSGKLSIYKLPESW